MREFCESLPSDRLLLGNDCDLDGLITAERSQKSYTEHSTGAKLTYNSSLAVLAHFVDCLVRWRPVITTHRTGSISLTILGFSHETSKQPPSQTTS